MEILGSIKKISMLGVSVALPGGLSGFVPITEISDPLTEEVQKAMSDQDRKKSPGGDDEDGDDDDEAEVISPLLSLHFFVVKFYYYTLAMFA
jgi:rRNA biogenesis protein RRP5